MASSTILKDFRNFIMRGNVLDLAVAVIIGAAFNAVVQSLVNDILLQLIGALTGKPSFDKLNFAINNSLIRYGHFITVLVNFLIVAAAIFVIVRVFDNLQARRRSGAVQPEDGPAPTDEALLLTEIRDLLAAQSGRSTPPTAG